MLSGFFTGFGAAFGFAFGVSVLIASLIYWGEDVSLTERVPTSLQS